ncbi:MAG TPA: PQQ-binding-like beta-propeller repeat protein [Planctomycetota bacterium]|nr:PQQ-binding-like beta-propeller repeat protein [Planctomycetota bacterium]
MVSMRRLCAALLAFAWAAAAAAEGPVGRGDAPGGLCAIVGASDADLALALARQGRLVVHCLATDAKARDAMRAAIRSQGLYGTVSAGVLDGGRLPYADNLLNLVVVAGSGPQVPEEEIRRVLVPNGVAKWLPAEPRNPEPRILRKPWPPEIDEWTHYLHGPDGNPVAADRVVGPPAHYQWVADPLWLRSHETDSSVSTLVTARGRLFAIVDEAPISLAGQHDLPDKWALVARDAFNGVLLWKVPIARWGWREWKPLWFNTRPGDIPLNIQKRLVAVGERVYVTLGYRAPVSQLDARTGQTLQTYPGTEQTGEILCVDDTLVLSVLVGDKVKVVAVDPATGRQKWASRDAYRGSTVDYIKWKEMHGGGPPAKLDPSLNMATDGKVVALLDGAEIACLDFQTGAEKWRSAFPTDKADERAGGIQAGANLWIGTLIARDGVVVHASPSKLAAFAADTGTLLWSQPKKYIGHLWYEWKDVFVIGGLVWTWGADLGVGVLSGAGKGQQRTLYPKSVNGYDLRTGRLVREVSLGSIFIANHHHRCYRNKATVRYILASRRGTEFVDLEQGQHTVHNWVRGTCHVGMMPANGLQYAPPHPCVCYIEEKLNGLTALAPASVGARPANDGPKLEHGPAFSAIENPQPEIENPQDWPAFRHDPARSGSASTDVPDGAALLWRVHVGSRVSPPTVAGDRLFVALVDEHHVACLDARDGSKRWEFAAGGRVDSPPTWHRGTVVFGSADGWVYCLRAADGQLAWRFRAAPAERLICAFGQLESAWPVHGSVLVLNGVAYFAAGRTSQLDGGIYLCGVDAATGKLLHQARLEGPDYAVGGFERNFRLPMGALPDVLASDGSKIYMRGEAFDLELKRQTGKPPLQTRSGFLDDSYFKRTPWTLGGEYARLIVHDSRLVCYVRMFDSLRGLDPTVYFTPGAKGYLLFAKDAGGKRSLWSQRVPVRIRAMVLAAGRLFVAGPPDLLEPKDPLGAFEGRKGALLYVLAADSGEKRAEHALPAPPVFNGAAAANRRLFLADEAGSVACFGTR